MLSKKQVLAIAKGSIRVADFFKNNVLPYLAISLGLPFQLLQLVMLSTLLECVS